MAAIAPSPDQSANLMGNLGLESQDNDSIDSLPSKESSSLDSEKPAKAQNPFSERPITPFFPDSFDPNVYSLPSGYHPSSCYYGCGNNPRRANGAHYNAGTYGGCWSLNQGCYGFTPYDYYASSNATQGAGNERKGTKNNLLNSFSSNSPSSLPAVDKEELSSAISDDKPSEFKENSCLTSSKPNNQTACCGVGLSPSFCDSKCSPKCQNDCLSKVKDNPYSRSYYRHNSNVMGYQYPELYPGYGFPYAYMNRMYPNKCYGSYGYNLGYNFFGYDPRVCNFSPDNSRFKSKGRGVGWPACYPGNADCLDERNRGPRIDGSNKLKDANESNKAELSNLFDRDQYNIPDFPEDYPFAKFFVIKSYSEDDVHKSIKYNLWSSTPNGNKKLNAAYNEAQKISTGCPIFLLFSVNTSGQFVGLAEMIGPVDFDKNVDYWQQDKWTGCFPVKWHILKDISNNLLRHITLENNENKPVTNSRDTQEVMPPHGSEIIKIFKNHVSKTCILDDFSFYEEREKIIRERKAKRQSFLLQGVANQVDDTTKPPEVATINEALTSVKLEPSNSGSESESSNEEMTCQPIL